MRLSPAAGNASASFQRSQYFSGVSIRPQRSPSLSLPAMMSWMVAKNGRMNSFFWLSRFWRMPSVTDTVERFSSSTPRAMPLT